MKNKGFTLIELLAIIVILAIIAVITVPLILGIIDESKEKSIVSSVHGFKEAILNHSMSLQTRNSNSEGLKGSYTVEELKTAGLNVSGQEPNNGIILIDNDGVSGCLQYDEYASYLYNNELINTAKGTCPSEKLATTGDGLYKSATEPGRLIYRGANPNNRIFLKEDGTNNTLYRIISYEPDGKIKVVRDEKLLNKEWDEANSRLSNGTNNTYCTSADGCNVWGSQETTLHNGTSLGNNFHYFYYTSANTTTFTNGASGKVEKESTLNKYLNDGSWTNLSNIDEYIDSNSWNVGGVYYVASGKDIAKEKEEERQLKWNGKIGLMNATEYVEASLNPTCTSVSSNYTSAPCKELNWVYKNYNQWTLSPITSSRYVVWYMTSSGNFSTGSAFVSSTGVRPTFYLKSNVTLSRSGAENDEYIID